MQACASFPKGSSIMCLASLRRMQALRAASPAIIARLPRRLYRVVSIPLVAEPRQKIRTSILELRVVQIHKPVSVNVLLVDRATRGAIQLDVLRQVVAQLADMSAVSPIHFGGLLKQILVLLSQLVIVRGLASWVTTAIMAESRVDLPRQRFVLVFIHLGGVIPRLNGVAASCKCVLHREVRRIDLLARMLAEPIPIDLRHDLVGKRIQNGSPAEVRPACQARLHHMLRPLVAGHPLLCQRLDVLRVAEAPLLHVEPTGIGLRFAGDGAVDRVVRLQHNHVLGLQHHGCIPNPPEEGPRVPTIVCRRAERKCATFCHAERREIKTSITHNIHRRCREELFQLPHLEDYSLRVPEDMQVETVLLLRLLNRRCRRDIGGRRRHRRLHHRRRRRRWRRRPRQLPC
mmetsp:Transcript_138966/g.443387  ORF Transcript_138966/g.443387 Transcript_138966/m.443387 type:complete len:402 (-) Transcript_138966:292-1497(-)